jgi:hypothetical protein
MTTIKAKDANGQWVRIAGGSFFWRGTKAAYDAIPTKDPAVLYVIEDESTSAWLTDGAADARFVNTAGDTMTGNLIVQKASPAITNDATSGTATVINKAAAGTAYYYADAPSGQYAGIVLRTEAGKNRWVLTKSNVAETGANAGADLIVLRYGDDGIYIGSAASISRATGLITVVGDPTAALGVATKQYVDNKGKWQAYTPTLSGIPGTVSGRYTRIGNTVHFTAIVVVTGAPTREVAVGLPVAALVTPSAPPLTFPVRLVAAGASYLGTTLHDSASTVLVRWVNPDLKNGFSPISATVPAAWASGDSIRLGGTYEAA